MWSWSATAILSASPRPAKRRLRVRLAAIKAEWKPGPPISGKTLFDDLKKPSARGQDAGGERGGRGGSGQPTGSIKAGLDAADVRLEQTYTIAYIAHAPLEPRAAVAQWENGKLTVWTGTQRPFGVRGELAGAFRLADDAVRVIVPDTGAGYGGKHTGEAAVEAARIAREAGTAGEAGLDARGRIHLGLLPAGRRHRDQKRRTPRRLAHRLGVSQL